MFRLQNLAGFEIGKWNLDVSYIMSEKVPNPFSNLPKFNIVFQLNALLLYTDLHSSQNFNFASL